MATAASLVRISRKASKLTQLELAARARVDQSALSRIENGRDADFGTVDRIIRGTGHRLIAVRTRRPDVATLVTDIARSLREGDKQLAIRDLIQLNDNLVAERGLLRGVLALVEPELTGLPTWDAAIAALVEWRLTEEKIPVPEWVHSPERTLSTLGVLELDPADPPPTIGDVPNEFLQHGVLAWRDTFESV